MPELSRFYGIVIRMHQRSKEHMPPHIHAVYGNYQITIDIQSLKIIEGSFPRKGVTLVLDWIELHKDELLDIWDTQNFRKVEPLK